MHPTPSSVADGDKEEADNDVRHEGDPGAEEAKREEFDHDDGQKRPDAERAERHGERRIERIAGSAEGARVDLEGGREGLVDCGEDHHARAKLDDDRFLGEAADQLAAEHEHDDAHESRDEGADSLAGCGCCPGSIGIAAAERLACEAGGGDAECLAVHEGQVEDGKYDLMRGEHVGAERCDGERVEQEAEAEGDLLARRGEADPEYALEHGEIGLDVGAAEMKFDKFGRSLARFSERSAEDSPKGHGAADAVTDHRGDGGAGDAEAGKAELAVDQEVVEKDIHEVGGEVVAHGELGVADAPQEGRDRDREHGGDEAEHQDLEVDGARLDGVGTGAHERDHGPREDDAGDRQEKS